MEIDYSSLESEVTTLTILGLDLQADLVFFVTFFIVIVGWGIFKEYYRRHKPIQLTGSSALLSYYSHNKVVTPLHSGEVGDGIFYTAFMAKDMVRRSGLFRAMGAKNSIIYRIELPFRTHIHLLGVPKNGYATRIRPLLGSAALEKVTLEGDFPHYFDLYTDSGKQTQARYILDPKSMVFVIDFCISHSWEIIEDELYFVETVGTKVQSDPTTMYEDILQFVQEIRPAIEDKTTPKNHTLTLPYGSVRPRNISCPVCKQVLIAKKHWYECPAHHGILINGGELIALRDHKKTVRSQAPDTQHAKEHQGITCPACYTAMQAVAYGGGSTIIDSCTNCHYRWIDAGELQQIVL